MATSQQELPDGKSCVLGPLIIRKLKSNIRNSKFMIHFKHQIIGLIV